MHHRRPALIVALLTLCVGVFAGLYGSRPPLWIRHTLGDVAAAGLVFALLSLIQPTAPRARRVILALLLAGAVEGIQALEWVGPDAPLLLHLTLGATFDPLDLAAYALGVLVASGLEWGILCWVSKRLQILKVKN